MTVLQAWEIYKMFRNTRYNDIYVVLTVEIEEP